MDFGRVEGSSDLVGTATLGITGPGCVWLPDGTAADIQTGPEGLGQVGITSEASADGNCVTVADGQRGEIAFRLTAEQGGNGTLAGNLPVTVSPLDKPDRAAVVQVPFTADLQKPLQTRNFVLTLIAALLLGPGIPLLLLWLFKLATARIPGEPLSALEIPVVVRDGEVYRDGLPLALRDTDFRDLVTLKTGGSRTARRSRRHPQGQDGLVPVRRRSRRGGDAGAGGAVLGVPATAGTRRGRAAAAGGPQHLDRHPGRGRPARHRHRGPAGRRRPLAPTGSGRGREGAAAAVDGCPRRGRSGRAGGERTVRGAGRARLAGRWPG